MLKNSLYLIPLLNNRYPYWKLRMLHEISNVKQKARSQDRRWFTDNDMDLFVWFSRLNPIGFQLSYNKQSNEKAVCWETDKGFQHYRVDSGEIEPIKYKMSPIYAAEDDFDTYAIAREFLHNSEHIENTLTDFIYARLLEYPSTNEKRLNQDFVSSKF